MKEEGGGIRNQMEQFGSYWHNATLSGTRNRHSAALVLFFGFCMMCSHLSLMLSSQAHGPPLLLNRHSYHTHTDDQIMGSNTLASTMTPEMAVAMVCMAMVLTFYPPSRKVISAAGFLVKGMLECADEYNSVYIDDEDHH
ncbi:hypothetical protein Naga_100018g33 [Nannochloropsis gaditana]|uniref:Uncharacterized protein n=1 Tax=Nannochloropsis gaditana TaxID=72520 RepID=W7TL87_9STRA|nr:hypothetical protein Naga_100018g33 [Nannochloropsis gaditana]